MQRRECPQIVRIHIRSVLDQQLSHLKVSVRTGIVQRNQSTLVLGMDIGTLLQQDLNDTNAIVTGCQVKGRRASTIARMAIDVERSEECDESIFGAGSSRLEEFIFAVLTG